MGNIFSSVKHLYETIKNMFDWKIWLMSILPTLPILMYKHDNKLIVLFFMTLCSFVTGYVSQLIHCNKGKNRDFKEKSLKSLNFAYWLPLILSMLWILQYGMQIVPVPGIKTIISDVILSNNSTLCCVLLLFSCIVLSSFKGSNC